jgi:hypothetical protein
MDDNDDAEGAAAGRTQLCPENHHFRLTAGAVVVTPAAKTKTG